MLLPKMFVCDAFDNIENNNVRAYQLYDIWYRLYYIKFNLEHDFSSRSTFRNANKEFQWTEPHVTSTDGQFRERVQQPRWIDRCATTATVASVVWSTVRNHRQRETSQSGGPTVAKLRLQIPDIWRRLCRQVRSHIHERYIIIY